MHAGDLLHGRARLTPGREALLELGSGRRYTYAELDERAARAARFLRDRLGVEPGDRVSILAHNSVAYLDLLYGAARLGAIFAPLNWRLTPAELRYILDDMEPRVVCVGADFAEVAAELRAGSRASWVALEDGALEGAPAYEAELAAAAAEIEVHPGVGPDTPLCLLYTSGTTGRPKGALLPHRQLLWNCVNTVVSWGLREDDVTPVLTPLFHTGGLFAFLTPVLYAGGRVVLDRAFDPDRSLRTIVEERCTVILGVPTLFQMWRECAAYREADLSHVRFFVSGGAPCPPPLMDAWRREKRVVVRQGYGLTEAGPNCFSMTDEESVSRSGSVGRPVLHAAVRVVDPETGREVGPEEEGELWIAGPHVFAGYWRNGAATEEALSGGWLRTGDTFRRDRDGYFHVLGRYKDMIKSGGENIYAAEVEAVFREHPAVADAALIGEPDPKWGEVGLMLVVRRAGSECAARDLLSFCDGRLARYKIPKRVVFVDSLPYSPYGKVQKAELRRRYLAAAEAR